MKKIFVTVLSASIVLGWAMAAQAGSVVQKEDYEFNLSAVLEDGALPININDYDRVYAGGTKVLFEQFNPALGTLYKAKLEAKINIAGEVFIYNIPFDATPFEAVEAEALPLGTSVEFLGKATAGPLEAPFDFDEYEVGVDGVLIDRSLIIDEHGFGMDMTDDPTELDFFLGTGTFYADVVACVMVNYDEFTLGGGEFLEATGEVTLTYEFRGDKVVPTPAAFGAGLALLGTLSLRRRRA